MFLVFTNNIKTTAAPATRAYPDGNYTAAASAADLVGVLDFLKVMSAYVFAHDKGVGLEAALRSNVEPISSDTEIDVVPKTGHWIADENPKWTARRVAQFFSRHDSTLPDIDFSALADRVTLDVGYYGTRRNMALAGMVSR
ncbi:hypothetical protein ACO1O0_004706 [Amphichorda felina]